MSTQGSANHDPVALAREALEQKTKHPYWAHTNCQICELAQAVLDKQAKLNNQAELSMHVRRYQDQQSEHIEKQDAHIKELESLLSEGLTFILGGYFKHTWEGQWEQKARAALAGKPEGDK